MANNKKLYKEAVAVFGHARQAEMMVEECAELIQALQKFKRGEPNNKLKSRLMTIYVKK